MWRYETLQVLQEHELCSVHFSALSQLRTLEEPIESAVHIRVGPLFALVDFLKYSVLAILNFAQDLEKIRPGVNLRDLQRVWIAI